MLPSAEPALMSARPLLCVGGQSENSISLEKPFCLNTESCPGGLYGLRLIDGLESYVIDIRSAKALAYIQASHILLPEEAEISADKNTPRFLTGLRLRFYSNSASHWGDEHSNTLFLTIY